MLKPKTRDNLRLSAVFFLTLFLFSTPLTVQAHRVTIFAWVEGNTIHTESKFGGGRKVQGGEVLVLDETGAQLLSGKTDENGEFSFPVPKKTALKVVLVATMGHRAEWDIPLSEITGEEDIPAGNSHKTETAPEPQTLSARTVSTQELENAVERVLDRKLRPINRMLAEIQQPGPSFRDVFGGIGYILGLVGIATYFRYRK